MPKFDLPVFRDEAVAIQLGETRYTVDLDEATVESLANGVCPEDLAERMWKNLSWRREASRHQAREQPRRR